MFDFPRACREKHWPFITEGHHHCHQGWGQTHCPFCGNGLGGWHLGFHLVVGVFNCWRCGSHSGWDVVTALLKTRDKSEVYQLLEQYETGRKGQFTQKEIVRKRTLIPPPGMLDLQPVHRKYLKGRRFIPSHVSRLWDLKGTTHLGGPWSWRVVIPCRTADGTIVAYQGRALRDQQPRYRMTNDEDCLVHPKSILYGIDKVRGSKVLIVEGPTGVWRLGPGSVATLGIDWHIKQANQLRQFTHRYILFDPEPTAQNRARQLAEWLSYYPGTTEILSGFATDPGDMSDKESQSVMNSLGIL